MGFYPDAAKLRCWGKYMSKSGAETFWHGDSNVAEASWLVKNLLPEVGTALLSGQWGLYKSFALLDLGASVITGNPFAGHRVVRRGGVLVFAAEGAGTFPKRLKGLAQCGKLPEEPQPFAWKSTVPPLLASGTSAELERQTREVEKRMVESWNVPLVLIAVDTLVAAAGFKDESSAAEAQAALNVLNGLAKRFQCCVLGIDHFGKVVETGTRGSSAKEGAVDAVLALLGDRKLSGEVSNTRMAIRKLRDGESGKEISFEARVLKLGIDRDGDPITTRTIEWKLSAGPTESQPKKPIWTKTLAPLRKALMRVLAEQGQIARPGEADGPTVRAVDRESLRVEFFKWAIVDSTPENEADAKRKAFTRALTAAAGCGLIGVYEQLVWPILPEDEAVVNQDKEPSRYGAGIVNDPARGAGAYPN
jgi:AAA domain